MHHAPTRQKVAQMLHIPQVQKLQQQGDGTAGRVRDLNALMLSFLPVMPRSRTANTERMRHPINTCHVDNYSLVSLLLSRRFGEVLEETPLPSCKLDSNMTFSTGDASLSIQSCAVTELSAVSRVTL